MAYSYIVSRILDNYPHLDPKQVETLLFHGSFASLKDRFVYQQILKAACTTMKILFRDLYDSSPLKLFAPFHRETRRDMFIHARENIPLPSLTALDEKDQRDLLEAPDVLRFTIVRNPYTRVVSAWRDKVFLCEPSAEDVYAAVRGAAPGMGRKHPIGFAEFVSYLESRTNEVWDPHWRRQIDLAFPKAFAFTHVGKTEHLDATIGMLSRHLKYPHAIKVPHANEVVIKPAAHYSEELAQRVYALYEEDFTFFGYDSESWPRDQEDRQRIVSEECFIDEILERNVIIGHLYSEGDRLREKYDAAYRFSLARLKKELRRLIR